MQLSSRTHCNSFSSSRPCSRPRMSQRVAAAAGSSNGYVPPSASSLDRPAGGGSRSFDPPHANDAAAWPPRSDCIRPSNGANRGSSFSAASSSSSEGSISRPGGRGGRSDMPSSNDTPAGQDPALARPGGRAGRDLGLGGGSSAPAPQDPAYGRPGGRGGRDNMIGSSDTPVVPVSLDRPGGRGGRDGPTGGGDDGSSGGSGGGGSGSGDSGSSGSSDAGGFHFGNAVVSVAMYAGVIGAAWAGHQAFFAKEEPPKEASCCGCSKGKAAEAAGKSGKKK